MSLQSLYDLPAPAKLNLFLHIVGRRADGYHLLQSVFLLIDWADTLHLERRTDGLLRRHDLTTPLPADDLCMKAARALQKASGCTLGADISVAKQLPSGAGMGGGSSDAATVLLGLNRLWQLGWSRARLLALGATLGADVPFFVGGHNAWVEGIGELLTPMALPELENAHWAVVKPSASIATPEIFSSPELTRDTNTATVAGLLADIEQRRKTDESQLGNQQTASPFFGRNDLQPVAEALCPDVGSAGRWLDQRFGNSRMTGSGSAVFAQAGKYENFGKGAGNSPVATGLNGQVLGDDVFQDLPNGWVGRMCRGLPHHPLVGWAD